MAIAVVQKSAVTNATNLNSGVSFNVSLNGTTATNTLILQVAGTDGSNNSSGYVGGVSDGTNTWRYNGGNGDSTSSASHCNVTIFSAYNIAGGNVTVAVSNNALSTSGYFSAVLYEISGVPTTSVLDSGGVGSATNSSTGPITCTGGALANSGDIAFVCFSVNDNANSGPVTPGSWSSDGLSMSNFPAYGFAHILPASTSALSPNYGSLGYGDNWAIAMAAYQPASSASYTITAAQGAFTLTGENATLTFLQPTSGTILANPGAFNLIGAQSQSLLQLYANNATFAETGQAATLTAGTALSTLVGAYGAFTLTGENATLQTLAYTFPAFTGYFVLTGEAALIPPPIGVEYLPNFVGMEWLDASRVLYQGGFTELDPQIVKLKGPSAATKRGIVVGQTPAASTLVKPGASVQLSVASDHMLAVSFEAI